MSHRRENEYHISGRLPDIKPEFDVDEFVNSIIQAQLPTTQYINEESKKDQIFIHHTASSSNPFGVIDWWKQTSERVATAFVIGGNPGKSIKWKDGDILQCFSSKKWAWHLGLKATHLKKNGRSSADMNSMSVGIEICSWGQLTQKNGQFLSYMNVAVPESEVAEYPTPFRGYLYYQKYTDAQIESTRKLLLYLGKTYSIPLAFKGMEIFNIDERCLMGEAGIFTHVSCRPDKNDCHPQKELIEMLRSL